MNRETTNVEDWDKLTSAPHEAAHATVAAVNGQRPRC